MLGLTRPARTWHSTAGVVVRQHPPHLGTPPAPAPHLLRSFQRRADQQRPAAHTDEPVEECIALHESASVGSFGWLAQVDIAPVFGGLLPEVVLAEHSSGTIHKAVGIPATGKTHDAMWDCESVRLCLPVFALYAGCWRFGYHCPRVSIQMRLTLDHLSRRSAGPSRSCV